MQMVREQELFPRAPGQYHIEDDPKQRFAVGRGQAHQLRHVSGKHVHRIVLFLIIQIRLNLLRRHKPAKTENEHSHQSHRHFVVDLLRRVIAPLIRVRLFWNLRLFVLGSLLIVVRLLFP